MCLFIINLVLYMYIILFSWHMNVVVHSCGDNLKYVWKFIVSCDQLIKHMRDLETTGCYQLPNKAVFTFCQITKLDCYIPFYLTDACTLHVCCEE